jgi:cell division protein ZapB
MQTPVLDQIADRVDRLLLRHEELARTNALLRSEVAQLTQERDSLLSRLSAARSRIEALLARLNDKPTLGEPDKGAQP